MAKAIQGEVLNHAEAPYKHDANNQQSYFVDLQTEEGKKTLWGKGIKDAMVAKDIKNNEQVIFIDKGIADGSKKRVWDVERYEQPKELPNSIEPVVELTKQTSIAEKNNDATIKKTSLRAGISEDELPLPSSVKNNYFAKVQNRFLRDEKINFYDKENSDSVAFEDRSKSLNTSREDSKTIKAMLDVAQNKGWNAITIKGTEIFKREAWLEASLRGVEVTGFKPTEKDLVALDKLKEERSNNQIAKNAERNQDQSPSASNAPKPVVAEHKEEEKLEAIPSLDDKQDTDVDVKQEAQKLTPDVQQEAAPAGDLISEVVASIRAKKYEHLSNMEKMSAFSAKELEEKRLDYAAREGIPDDMYKELADKDSYLYDLNGRPSDQEAASDYLQNRAQRQADKLYNQQVLASLKTNQDVAMIAKLLDEATQDIDNEAWLNNAMKERFDQTLVEMHSFSEDTGKEFNRADYLAAAHQDLNDLTSYLAVTTQKQVMERYTDRLAEIEQEGFVRSEEFNAGRDIDKSPEAEVAADVEVFHDNLAVVNIPGMSSRESMARTEAAFDRRVDAPARENRKVSELEDKLKTTDRAAIEAIRNGSNIGVEGMRRIIDTRFAGQPDVLKEKHAALDARLPDIASGKIELQPPTVKQEPNIEVQTKDQGNMDRGR